MDDWNADEHELATDAGFRFQALALDPEVLWPVWTWDPFVPLMG